MTLLHSPSSRSAGIVSRLALAVGLALLVAAPACSSNSDGGSTTTGGSEGGACAAPAASTGADDHCAGEGGPINNEATSCPTTASADAGTAPDEAYPDPHNGTQAADDDCKYDVSYGIDCAGGAATLTVTVTDRTTHMGITGAAPTIEAQLGNAHPLPNPSPVTTEVGNGVYKISGVHFDMSGTWLVRFHFFEMCLDTEETSKHTHVAFNVSVP